MTVSTTIGNDLDLTTYLNQTSESPDVFRGEVTEKPYQELKDRTHFCLGIISVTLIPFIFGGNFLVLLSLFVFRKLRSIQHMFIGCLASFDLLLSITSLPAYVVGFWFTDILLKYKYLCIFKYASVTFSCTGSLLSLLAIAVDRYIAVLYPLKYPLKMTTCKAKKMMAVIWIYSTVIGFIPFVWHNKDVKIKKCEFSEIVTLQYFIVSVGLFVPAMIIPSIALYIRIFQIAIRQKKKMIKRRLQFDLASRRMLEKSTKSTSVMAIVLFFFVAFWFPFMASATFRYFDMEENILSVVKSIVASLAQSNSGINPIIYCFMKTDFRIAFKLLFKRFLGKGRINRDAGLSENKEEELSRTVSKVDDMEMKAVTNHCQRVQVHL